MLLAILAASGPKRDTYLNGGAVEALEACYARERREVRPLFLLTGTLANHSVLRCLAGSRA